MNIVENNWRICAWVFFIGVVATTPLGCDVLKAGQADHSGEQGKVASVYASNVTEEKPRDPNRLWCNGHDVYEDECYLCHPELAPDPKSDSGQPDHGEEVAARDPNRDWCAGHNVYEDECFICNPELAPDPNSDSGQPEHGEEVAARDPNRDWCAGHNVYEDACYICNPHLAPDSNSDSGQPEHGEEVPVRDPNRDWCAGHNVYEDACYICNPHLAPDSKSDSGQTEAGEEVATRDPNRLWCNGHNVYEDECFLCHPELAEQDSSTVVGALMCNEHRVAEKECGICHPELLVALPLGDGLKVRFSSDASVSKAGIKIGRANAATVSRASEVLGQVSFDRNKFAVITPLGEGVLRDILVDVGDSVEAGQLLATVVSPAVASAKSSYLNALAESKLRREVYAREKDLYEQKISARQDFEEARAALATSESGIENARQTLINLGLREADLTAVAGSQSRNSELSVRAPFSGTVVERDAVIGTAVEPGMALFSVADMSAMWMELSIPETQLVGLERGASIQARFEALPGLAFDGILTQIGYSVDARTRMVKARAELNNAQRVLKHGMFGRIQLSGSVHTAGLRVPEAAVQIVDGRPVVFAKLEEDLFEARPVQLGAAQGGYVSVLAGISSDDNIVINESFVMKSEFLIARLGAGCTDH